MDDLTLSRVEKDSGHLIRELLSLQIDGDRGSFFKELVELLELEGVMLCFQSENNRIATDTFYLVPDRKPYNPLFIRAVEGF